jgi:hypothetical protein
MPAASKNFYNGAHVIRPGLVMLLEKIERPNFLEKRRPATILGYSLPKCGKCALEPAIT